MNYQTKYGVFVTLDLISRALNAPHKLWTIRIEPRSVEGSVPTAWDLGFDLPDSLVEAKLRPTRQDLLDWLERVRAAENSVPDKKFLFVYSVRSGTVLRTLEQLCRLAFEAVSEDEFGRLVELEGPIGVSDVEERLGPNWFVVLRRLAIENLPENLLQRNLEMSARWLAGDRGSAGLREFLFTKLSEGIPTRATFNVRQLIEEATERGINLQAPKRLNPSDSSELQISTMTILQACPHRIPLTVVAQATRSSEETLRADISDLRDSGVVQCEDNFLSMQPLLSELAPENRSDLLRQALDSLILYIRSDVSKIPSHQQVQNVRAFAEACYSSNPLAAAKVFEHLDHHLKRLGDKHLLFDLANLSVRAARRCPPQQREEALEAEARALICGVCWAYQRIGRPEKARVYALDSVKICEMAGLQTTKAFCEKCVGRLCRIEADGLSTPSDKESKLHESVARLEQAISEFSELDQFGPESAQVGDCHSLLGRTHLAAGRRHRAEEAVRRASNILTEAHGKYYWVRVCT